MALEDMTKEQLREACDRNGVEYDGRAGVQKLAELLREHAAGLDAEAEAKVADADATPPDDADDEAAGDDEPAEPAAPAPAPAPKPKTRQRPGVDTCKCGHRHAIGQFKKCVACGAPLT